MGNESNERYNFIMLSMLFASAFLLYQYNTHIDFIGNDDYDFARNYANYGMWNVFPDNLSWAGLKQWLIINTEILFSDGHGFVPGLYIGPVYRLLDTIGVPITKQALHAPLSILGSLSVCLLFVLLKRNQFSSMLALIGSLLFMISPLHTVVCRGNGTAWLMMIPFNQLLCLLTFGLLSKRKSSQKATALAQIHLILSDVLFAISLPVLWLAYFSEGIFRVERFNSPLFWMRINARKKLLFSRRTMRFPAIIASILALSSVLIVLANIVGHHTQLTLLLDRIRGTPLSGETVRLIGNPFDLMGNLAMFFGELFPVIVLPLFAFGVMQLVKNKDSSLLLNFAVISTVLHSVAWYVLKPYNSATTYGYQIYLLIPLLLLVLFAFKNLTNRNGIIKPLSYCLLVALLFSTVAANMGIIWKKPSLLAPKTYIRDRTYGTVREDYGTKAAGCLVRDLIKAHADCASRPSSMFVLFDKDVHIDYRVSFMIYAGMRQSWGNMLKDEYGITVCREDKDDIRSNILQAQTSVAPFNVILGFNFPGEEPIDIDSNCDFSIYQIVSGNKLLISIYLFSSFQDNFAGPLPGVYNLDSLNCRYDNTYNKLRDFFDDF